MIRAIIFDFDGLILDTESADFTAWREICQAHGCDLSFSTWAQGVGVSLEMFDLRDYLESQTRQPVDRAEIYARHRRRWTELSEAQPILPGVVDCIAGAKRRGLQLGLASSGRRDWVVGHLSRLGLEADFDCIKCLEDVSTAKPEPELYLSALSEMGVAPGQAIALEDSPNGILAAKRAGLYCVVVPNPMTRHLPLDQADLRLDSLADVSLESLLAKAGAGLR